MTSLEESKLDAEIADLQRRLAASNAKFDAQCQQVAQLQAQPVGGVPPVGDPALQEQGGTVARVDRQARAMASAEGIPMHEAYRRIFAADASNMLGINYSREQKQRVQAERAATAAFLGGDR